jgi:hypothetical protein
MNGRSGSGNDLDGAGTAPSGRTGARRPPRAAGEPTRGRSTTYRGVRWRRDPDGTIGWYNVGAGGWVRWRPGADAPPLPPAWEADAASIPLPPRVSRASWRSPYRLVPIGLVVAAVALGTWQAIGTGQSAAVTARKEAAKLLGECFPLAGAQPGHYATTPVACDGPDAAVRVVRVLEPGRTGQRCAPGSTPVRLSYLGAPTLDVECVQAVRHG